MSRIHGGVLPQIQKADGSREISSVRAVLIGDSLHHDLLIMTMKTAGARCRQGTQICFQVPVCLIFKMKTFSNDFFPVVQAIHPHTGNVTVCSSSCHCPFEEYS